MPFLNYNLFRSAHQKHSLNVWWSYHCVHSYFLQSPLVLNKSCMNPSVTSYCLPCSQRILFTVSFEKVSVSWSNYTMFVDLLKKWYLLLCPDDFHITRQLVISFSPHIFFLLFTRRLATHPDEGELVHNLNKCRELTIWLELKNLRTHMKEANYQENLINILLGWMVFYR